MKHIFLMQIACMAVLFSISCEQVIGGVIHNTLGPVDSFDTGARRIGRYFRDGTFSGTNLDVAVPFTPSTNVTLLTIEVPIGLYNYSTDPLLDPTIDVFLMDDAAGLPSSVLETFSIVMPDRNTPPSLYLFNSQVNPLLQGGNQYWVVASSSSGNAFAGWFSTDPAIIGMWASGEGLEFGENRTFGMVHNRSNTIVPAMRISGLTSVPEPSTFVLLGIGGIALVGYRYRRKRQQDA